MPTLRIVLASVVLATFSSQAFALNPQPLPPKFGKYKTERVVKVQKFNQSKTR
jgi:hypothetical protein